VTHLFRSLNSWNLGQDDPGKRVRFHRVTAGAGRLQLLAHRCSDAPAALAKRRSSNFASVRQKCRESLNPFLARANAARGHCGGLNAKLSDLNKRGKRESFAFQVCRSLHGLRQL
jgi:hypothetical protein